MIGQFARSVAGHDIGKLYIVLEERADFVLLTDGKLKKTDKPKKKNPKHVQLIGRMVDSDLVDAINLKKANVNDVIRIAIKREEKNV